MKVTRGTHLQYCGLGAHRSTEQPMIIFHHHVDSYHVQVTIKPNTLPKVNLVLKIGLGLNCLIGSTVCGGTMVRTRFKITIVNLTYLQIGIISKELNDDEIKQFFTSLLILDSRLFCIFPLLQYIFTYLTVRIVVFFFF